MPRLVSRKIHVIEDDPEFGAYLLELLEDSFEAEVRLFTDGLTGMGACLRDVPDVLVLDLNLPSLRGEEICRLLRASAPHRGIRILVCSDMPEAQRREMELLAMGADLYFPKPFREKEFLAEVARLAAGSGLEDTAIDHGQANRASLVQESGTEPLHAAEVPPESVSDPEPTHLLLHRFGTKAPEFEGYEIFGVIGGGAMGTVYKARQRSLGRMVALKVFLRNPKDPPEFLERFQREGQIMAHLDHPHIVEVHDTGHTGYTYFLAMEHMSGGSVMQAIERGGITWGFVRRVIDEAGAALAYLHQNQVIHRDIKPGNLLIAFDGTIKLGDFGVSYARLPHDQDEFTRQYQLLGTRQYMAPEVLLGEYATAPSDQYALGRAILRLFEGTEPTSPPRPLARVFPDAPDSFARHLARTMEMDARNRFPSVAEARAALLESLPEDLGRVVSPERIPGG